jgi:uncharacterized protein
MTWPHYFGPPEAPLFGCYHPPAPGAKTPGTARTPAASGVLLCNPVGHEYMACYRTMRQTAVRLAQAGLPAFRFDFYGSGDSAGDSADGRPSRWLRDIGAASAELQRRDQACDVALGWRLGATLALLAVQAEPRFTPRALVLWDPIVRGDTYVAELTAVHQERFGRSTGGEILGFPFTAALRAELERIDLRTVQRSVRHVLMIETGPAQRETDAVADRLASFGASVERRSVAGSGMWHEPNKASVPASAIQTIVAWIRNGWREGATNEIHG